MPITTQTPLAFSPSLVRVRPFLSAVDSSKQQAPEKAPTSEDTLSSDPYVAEAQLAGKVVVSGFTALAGALLGGCVGGVVGAGTGAFIGASYGAFASVAGAMVLGAAGSVVGGLIGARLAAG